MVVFGAGTAGVGIADQVVDAIMRELRVSKEIVKKIWCVPVLTFRQLPVTHYANRLIDKPGLLTDKTKDISEAQKVYARSDWDHEQSDLLVVVKQVKPNILVGTSTVPRAFIEEIVRAMAEGTERPIILPLSNPARLHEAIPEDLLRWTNGKALVATGSPFKPVRGPWGTDGKEIELEVAEYNNSVVFPGIGLGVVLSRAKLITDKMLIAAVGGMVELSPALQDDTSPLLPGVKDVREVSLRVSRKVIQAAVEGGVATAEGISEDVGELDGWIRSRCGIRSSGR